MATAGEVTTKRSRRKIDIGLHGGKQLNLGLLSSLTDTLNGHAVANQVKTGSLFEVGNDIADESNMKSSPPNDLRWRVVEYFEPEYGRKRWKDCLLSVTCL